MKAKVTDFPERVGGADSKASLNVLCGNWFQNKIYRNYTSCFFIRNLQNISLEMKGYGHASVLTIDLLLDDFLKQCWMPLRMQMYFLQNTVTLILAWKQSNLENYRIVEFNLLYWRTWYMFLCKSSLPFLILTWLFHPQLCLLHQ